MSVRTALPPPSASHCTSRCAAVDSRTPPSKPHNITFTEPIATIWMQGVSIYSAGNMAITEFQGGGGNHYNNVFLVPRGPTTPLASNADGFHSSGMRHGPTLSNVSMLNLLDDYFNVHNTFQIVAKRAGPRSVLVGDYQYLAGDNTLYVLVLPECNHTRRPAHHPLYPRPLLVSYPPSLLFFGGGVVAFCVDVVGGCVCVSHVSICERIRSIQ